MSTIKRIKSSILDRKYLALRSIDTPPIKVDLSRMVVNKPWGHEYLLTSTPLVEVWHLFLDYSRSTSMHCHPNKKTALIVLEGRALFSYVNGSMELKPLDAVIIDSGVFHSTQATSKKGLKLIEVENPPMKHDLIRLEDKYGRTNVGYEGSEQMKLINTSFIGFGNHSNCKINNIGNCNLNIYFFNNQEDLDKKMFKAGGIGIILSGIIKSKKDKITHGAGDIILLKDLKTNKINLQNVSLLSIQKEKQDKTDYI